MVGREVAEGAQRLGGSWVRSILAGSEKRLGIWGYRRTDQRGKSTKQCRWGDSGEVEARI